MNRIAILLALACATTALAQRKPRWPAKLQGAERVVYKTVGDVKLHLHIFRPTVKSSRARPAIVFFFGGGWRGGSPRQFQHQCRYLASRGMVAMTAEYRIRNLHGTLAHKCVSDGKSAIRWVRANARKLGIDPHRIAAGGGSAGGHVAACTGVLPGFEEKGEDTKIKSVPDALVLFNPAVVLAPTKERQDFLNAKNLAGNHRYLD